jgi:hypothetical protein
MKKALIIFVFSVINASAFAQAIKSKTQYEEVYADSMYCYISNALHGSWSAKKYDRRIVISRRDSVYLQFEVPLNSPYIFNNDTADFYRLHRKYKMEIYVDIPLEYWSDSTFYLCKVHNDSIRYLIEQEVNQSRKKPVADQMNEHVRIEKRLTLLNAQLINMPVAFTNGLAIYVSDNCPVGCMAIDARAEGKGRDASRKAINKEIDEAKDICTNIIKTHLKIQYKY